MAMIMIVVLFVRLDFVLYKKCVEQRCVPQALLYSSRCCDTFYGTSSVLARGRSSCRSAPLSVVQQQQSVIIYERRISRYAATGFSRVYSTCDSWCKLFS